MSEDYTPGDVAQTVASLIGSAAVQTVAVEKTGVVREFGRGASFDMLMADGRIYRIRVEEMEA